MSNRGLWTACALLAAFDMGLSVGQADAAWVTASAYSPADSGSVTACGPALDWSTPTVAHRWLPCGTRVRLCVSRRRCVTARVTDRGPFVGGRELDLGPGAYTRLGASSPDAWGVRSVWMRRVR